VLVIHVSVVFPRPDLQHASRGSLQDLKRVGIPHVGFRNGVAVIPEGWEQEVIIALGDTSAACPTLLGVYPSGTVGRLKHEDFVKNEPDNLDVGGLGKHFIHRVGPRLLYVLWLSVPSAGYNEWLRLVSLSQRGSDLLGSLETIHDGHAAVHKDQGIGVRLSSFEPTLHQFNGLETVPSLVN